MTDLERVRENYRRQGFVTVYDAVIDTHLKEDAERDEQLAGPVWQERDAARAEAKELRAELASLKEELAKLYVLLADEQAENAGLREALRTHHEDGYCPLIDPDATIALTGTDSRYPKNN